MGRIRQCRPAKMAKVEYEDRHYKYKRQLAYAEYFQMTDKDIASDVTVHGFESGR